MASFLDHVEGVADPPMTTHQLPSLLKAWMLNPLGVATIPLNAWAVASLQILFIQAKTDGDDPDFVLSQPNKDAFKEIKDSYEALVTPEEKAERIALIEPALELRRASIKESDPDIILSRAQLMTVVGMSNDT